MDSIKSHSLGDAESEVSSGEDVETSKPLENDLRVSAEVALQTLDKMKLFWQDQDTNVSHVLTT